MRCVNQDDSCTTFRFPPARRLACKPGRYRLQEYLLCLGDEGLAWYVKQLGVSCDRCYSLPELCLTLLHLKQSIFFLKKSFLLSKVSSRNLLHSSSMCILVWLNRQLIRSRGFWNWRFWFGRFLLWICLWGFAFATCFWRHCRRGEWFLMKWMIRWCKSATWSRTRYFMRGLANLRNVHAICVEGYFCDEFCRGWKCIATFLLL